MTRVFKFAMPFLQGSLVKQILVGLVLGIILGMAAPEAAKGAGFLGTIFVTALKGVAPILVFVLVMSSIANQRLGEDLHIKPILVLYMISTFGAAVLAVIASFIWPTQIALVADAESLAAPGGILEVFENLILNVVDNPVHAIATANYIGILAWAIAMGVVLRHGVPATREVLSDAAKGVEFVVRIVVRFAPIGIFGLVASTLATTGLEAMTGYFKLLAVLIGTMAAVALILNPFLVWLTIRANPFPYTWMTLRESGVAAFFTRSSAANIPVNLEICRRLDLPESTYSVSIPVGATVNMAGAAITITVLTLSAAFSLGVTVDIPTAIFLSFIAAVCAAGASGVPGGSLMLIPLACGLFGIDQNTAMQVVAVGFIIGVLQDSCETALNSSSDALFTIAACKRAERLGIKMN
ncbi:MAG: serine/threonine transporter SstT [Sutterella parvirubra]|uniref:Serine/threonine transporter SstT n=1 Tax=Sutterella parvirubra YIT 11816 TaxID=762967 RepID=H3KE47_9BURK|nr:serine/threonine transporter SstT [Sutterella parvirubra]EHY31609.1 serine/threonine transporter SstT [Sutterella parvirubra YIT 11816]MCI7709807.1 serine/threonine transporter SstT [Sutterella parvirubra]MDR3770854.1 serine/threonine transporter SstT [Sutterella sp.]MDY5201284.1 serine/threonine transporter SstT [Sutterella parvirubra]